MTTLLQLVTQVCNSVPIAAPSAVVGNTNDQTAFLCLALANEAGDAVASRCPGSWTAAAREYDFQTQASGAIDGVLTSVGGFGVVTVATADIASLDITTTAWLISGTHLLNNSVITDIDVVGPNTAFTVNLPAETVGSGTYYFAQSDYPLPDDFARSIDGTFWDRTRYWQMRGSMSPQEWQGYRSSLYGKATIQSRWRFRNSDWLSSASGTPSVNVLSLDPVPQAPARQMVFEYVSNGWCANASTGARQTEWMADTDYAVFHPYLMRLDLKWRLLSRMGVTYQEALSEYEREADKAVARDGGTAVLSLTPTYGVGLLSPFGIQDGSFPGRG